MKLKHTKNGNIQITITADQASQLKGIINSSHFIPDVHQNEGQEEFSWGIFNLLSEAGISAN